MCGIVGYVGEKFILQLIITLLIAASALCVSGQTNSSSQDLCKMYGEKDFVGAEIDLDLKDTDVRQILKTFSKLTGINFIVDQSVKTETLSVKISKVFWNEALKAVLASQELVAVETTTGSVCALRITKAPNEGGYRDRIKYLEYSGPPLFTEFFRLKNLRIKYINHVYDVSAPDKATNRLLKIIASKLTRRGSVEVEPRTNTLIVTDTKGNIKTIIEYLEFIDNSGFTLEELFGEDTSQTK